MLKGYRTYVLGGVSIIGTLAAYLVGDLSLADAIQTGVTALLAMTVRNGIANAAR